MEASTPSGETNEVTAILERSWKRIEDPKHWCKGYLARNANGFAVSPVSEDACQFCAVGSIEAEGPTTRVYKTAIALITKAARSIFKTRSLEYVNDRLGHDAVRQLYALAIDLSKVATP